VPTYTGRSRDQRIAGHPRKDPGRSCRDLSAALTGEVTAALEDAARVALAG
jgi:hypothetical protein